MTTNADTGVVKGEFFPLLVSTTRLVETSATMLGIILEISRKSETKTVM